MIWVTMLLFVQTTLVARATTTYENMFGIQDGTASLPSTFTSTGTHLDPNHASNSVAGPGSGLSANGHAGNGRGGGGGGGRKHHGWLKRWSRILGVDAFIETARGHGRGNKQKRNPYSRGIMRNCNDFWCDPSPVFARRENGMAVLGGVEVSYTNMYESPRMMELGLGQVGRRTRGGRYEAVPTEEV